MTDLTIVVDVPKNRLKRWLELIEQIDGINVKYSLDQLVMANAAILKMKLLAVRIGADIDDVLDGR